MSVTRADAESMARRIIIRPIPDNAPMPTYEALWMADAFLKLLDKHEKLSVSVAKARNALQEWRDELEMPA